MKLKQIFLTFLAADLFCGTWQPTTNIEWGDPSNWSDGLIPGDTGNQNVPAIFPFVFPPTSSGVNLRKSGVPFTAILSGVEFQNSYGISFGTFEAPSGQSLTFTLESTALQPVILSDMTIGSTSSFNLIAPQGTSFYYGGTASIDNSTLSQTGAGNMSLSGTLQNIASSASPVKLDIEMENLVVNLPGRIDCKNTSISPGSNSELTFQSSSVEIFGAVQSESEPAGSTATLTFSDCNLSGSGGTAEASGNLGEGNLYIINSSFSGSTEYQSSGTIALMQITGSSGSLDTNSSGVYGKTSTLNIMNSSIELKNGADFYSSATLSDSNNQAVLSVENSTISIEKFSAFYVQSYGNQGEVSVKNSELNFLGGGVSSSGNGTNNVQTYVRIEDSSITGSSGFLASSCYAVGSNLIELKNTPVSLTDSITFFSRSLEANGSTITIDNSPISAPKITIQSQYWEPAGFFIVSPAANVVIQNSKITCEEALFEAKSDLSLAIPGTGTVKSDFQILNSELNLGQASLSSKVTCEGSTLLRISDAKFLINQSKILAESGSILCQSFNLPSTLFPTPGTAFLQIQGSTLEGIQEITSEAFGGTSNLEIYQSSIQSQDLAILSSSSNSTADIDIQDSQLTILDQGSLKNQGTSGSSMSFQNSSLTSFGDFSIRASSNATFTNSSISGVDLISSEMGNISLLSSTLSTTGLVSTPNVYEQDSLSALNLQFIAPDEYGKVEAGSLSLAGSLNVLLENTYIEPGVLVPLIESQTSITTNFTSRSFSGASPLQVPYFIDHEKEIFLLMSTSPGIMKIATVQSMVEIERGLRLQKQLTNMHQRMKAQTSGTILASLQDMSDSYIASNQEVAGLSELFSIFGARQVKEKVQEKVQKPSDNHWSLYAGPIGAVGHVNTQDGQLGNNFQSVGVQAGFDYASIEDETKPFGFGLGLTGSYLYHRAAVYQHEGKFHVQFAHANVYGLIVPKSQPNLSFNGSLGSGYEWVCGSRKTGLSDNPLYATSEYGGPTLDALAGLEYIFIDDPKPQDPRGFKVVLPIFNVQYARAWLPSFQEEGANNFNLSQENQSWTGLWTFLATRISYVSSPAKEIYIRPEVTLGWQRQWNSLDQSIVYSNFASSFPQTFVSSGKGPKRDTIVFGLDVNIRWYERASVQFDYDVLYNSAYVDNAFRVQLSRLF